MSKKLKMEDIYYIDRMCTDIIDSLNNISAELSKTHYLHSSKDRAKFKRLRVQLSKELLEIERKIY